MIRKIMRKAVLIAFMAAGAVGLPLEGVYATGNTIQFGMLAPMTGTNAIQGQDMTRGLKLAIDRINDGYAVPMMNGEKRKIGPGLLGKKVTSVLEDTGARPAEGMSGIRQLINVHKVDVVLGTYSSGVTIPTGKYTNESQTVMMAVATTSPQLRDIGPYFFDAIALDNIAGKAIARFAVKDSETTDFGSLVMNNPFGVGIELQTCKTLRKKFDGKCVSKVRYSEGKSDYRAELRQVMGPHPKAAFFTAFGTDAKLILRQAYQQGIAPKKGWYSPYMSTWANEVKDTPQIAEGIKGFIVGASGDFYQEQYAKAYKKAYGEPPTTSFGAYTYDGAMLLALAIDKAGTTDANAVRKAIPEVAKEYKGITGDKTMDGQGMQIKGNYQWKIFRKGQLEDYAYPK